MKHVLAAAAVMAVAGTASADITATVFSITATNADGQANWSFIIDNSETSQGDYNWRLDQGIQLIDPTNDMVIAELDSAEVQTIADPVVSVGFTVFATQQQTSFQVVSTVLSFPTINAAVGVARASAAVTVDDFNGDGAIFTPAAGGAYKAFFNGGSNQFTSLFNSPVSVGANGNGSFFDDTGAFAAVGFDTFDMSAQWDFTLSPGDLATGTSTFELVPAPGSMALIGLSGLAAARRRR